MTDAALLVQVRIARLLPASPDRVFRAWTDPTRVARWMSPYGHATAELEPWVGGRLRVVMVGEGSEIEHTGEYLEVEPGARPLFTRRSPAPGGRAPEARPTARRTQRRGRLSRGPSTYPPPPTPPGQPMRWRPTSSTPP